VTWIEWYVAAIGASYFIIGVGYFLRGEPWAGLTYVAYAVANAGLIGLVMTARSW
jgi:hypothetical protein